jgi:hypothetical protein
MRELPIGIRIPRPDPLLGEGRIVLIYDSTEPEQAFASSNPYIEDDYTETFPNSPNTPSDLQVSMTGGDASLSWTKSEK